MSSLPTRRGVVELTINAPSTLSFCSRSSVCSNSESTTSARATRSATFDTSAPLARLASTAAQVDPASSLAPNPETSCALKELSKRMGLVTTSEESAGTARLRMDEREVVRILTIDERHVLRRVLDDPTTPGKRVKTSLTISRSSDAICGSGGGAV